MAQIKINISNLDEQISLLSALNSSFSDRKTDIPEISGSGPVASRTQELGKMLLQIREILKDLFESTICFLSDTRNSYMETDTQIAAEYQESS